MSSLPDANSPDLYLAYPTPAERLSIWKMNALEWRGILPLETYLQREQHLLSAPLARDGGVTHWILVSKNDLPDSRAILSTCESLRKPALISVDGSLQYVLTHGIGSVFCNPQYRGHGYAGRMMREVGEKLRTWQCDPGTPGHEKVGFSILYSDIGKSFYASHGWHAFPSRHISFPVAGPTDERGIATVAKRLVSSDLPELCKIDVHMIEDQLRTAKDGRPHVALVPDYDALSWHHAREEFVCSHVFTGSIPLIKGAIIGEPGRRMWVVWTRSYYGPLDSSNGENTLHILRLVIEDELPSSGFSTLTGGPSYDKEKIGEKAEQLKAVMEVARSEAREWCLRQVMLWNPSTFVRMLVDSTGWEHSQVEREKESISSLMWYGEGKGGMDEIEWVGNEKFGWC